MSGFSHVQDSQLLGHLFSSAAMKEVFCDKAMLAGWLKAEQVLALEQARLGIIPDASADSIALACNVEHYDLTELGASIAKASHPLTPIIKALETQVGEHAQYVHFGATTQDIMDTGLVLQIRDGLDLIIASHRELVSECIRQARKWRSLPMAGRTHGQHAVPITLGLKFALWASETHRHQVRLEQVRSQLAVQFAGAAGTLATLPQSGARVRAGMAKALNLLDPHESWHTARDRIAQIVSQLALSCASCGKIGNEIVNLQRTEIGELLEGAAPGTGGSSTMPQKRNPMMAQNIVALAKLMSTKPTAMSEAMMHEHERDMAAWSIEWAIVPESFIYAHATLEQGVKLIRYVEVNEARIHKNLYATDGLICAEAVMMDLSHELGRNNAHHVIADIITLTASGDVNLETALNNDARINVHRTPEQISALLDPANYLGEAVSVVDRIVNELE